MHIYKVFFDCSFQNEIVVLVVIAVEGSSNNWGVDKCSDDDSVLFIYK